MKYLFVFTIEGVITGVVLGTILVFWAYETISSKVRKWRNKTKS